MKLLESLEDMTSYSVLSGAPDGYDNGIIVEDTKSRCPIRGRDVEAGRYEIKFVKPILYLDNY